MRRIGLVMVAMALVLAGCGDGEDRPGMVTKEGGSGSASGTHTGSASGTHAGSGTAAPPAFTEAQANTVVEVTLQDFSFIGIPSTIQGPKVFFKATNKGPADHELEVLDAGGHAVGEVAAMPTGKTGTLAVELKPGTYTAQCLVETDGKTHVESGMKTSFQVT